MSTRRRFQTLLGVILGAIAAYTAYWFFAISRAEQAFYEIVRAEQARGNAVEYANVTWSGYPIRLAATVTGLRYATSGVSFEAGQLLVEVLPWNLTNALLRAEGNVRIAYLEADRAERLELKPSLALANVRATWDGVLQQASLELRGVDAKGADMSGHLFAFRAARLQADARMANVTTTGLDSYDFAFSADRADLTSGFTTLLGPRIGSIRFAARLAKLPPFSSGYRPVGRRDFVQALQSNGVEAEIARFDFDWGQVAVRGLGRLGLDDDRRLTGELAFKVRGLSNLIDTLFAMGVLKGEAQILKDLPKTPDGELIALRLKDGLVNFGPYAVGALAPLD